MFESLEDSLTVVGQGSVSFDVGFLVAQGDARLVGKDNLPRPTCDPDKDDVVLMAFTGNLVTLSWKTYSKREVLWIARGCSA